MKDSASALWKVLEIGSEIMVFKRDMGLDYNHNVKLNLVIGRSGISHAKQFHEILVGNHEFHELSGMKTK